MAYRDELRLKFANQMTITHQNPVSGLELLRDATTPASGEHGNEQADWFYPH